MSHIFRDEEGNIILATSSSVPGITLVPPGKSLGDAQLVSDGEFHRLIQERGQAAEQGEKGRPSIEDLTVAVATLQAEVETLKQKYKGA